MSPQRRILVTGGSGFIGTNLVEALLAHGDAVLSIDIRPPQNPDHVKTYRSVDLLDADGLLREVDVFQPSSIVHLGARTDLEGTKMDEYSANTAGTENLIRAAASATSVEYVVFASSRLVCEIGYTPTHEEDVCPSTAYGESKAACERIVRDANNVNFAWTIVRPTSIWGPWFGEPYSVFFEAVASGRYAHPRGRRIRKSFGYVGNTVHQLIGLIEQGADTLNHRTIYLGDDPPIEVLDWARMVAQATGGRSPREVPVPILRAAAIGGDIYERLTGRHAALTTFRLKNLMTEMIYDLGPIRQISANSPHSVGNGVETTVSWISRQSSS